MLDDEIGASPPPGGGTVRLEVSIPGGNGISNKPSRLKSQEKKLYAAARAARQRDIDARARIRRRRLIEHLHRLGPQPLGYFLAEIEGATGTDVTARLERYARLPADFIKACGGDQYPPMLWAIDGGRR
jgi:hypothetical protein